MTENKTGPVRVEEPVGYDHTPTERIPVPGDLSDDQTTAAPPEKSVEDGREESAEVNDTAEPEAPVEPVTAPAEPPADAHFFEESVLSRFRDRWRELQAGFVDDPAQAVRGADELVDEIMRELVEHRESLEERWQGRPEDTEQLRVIIRAYRVFFNHLLNA